MHDLQAQNTYFSLASAKLILREKKNARLHSGQTQETGPRDAKFGSWCATLGALAHLAAITHIGCV
jgi:hypothetical protein